MRDETLVYSPVYGTLSPMGADTILDVVFYQSESGNEPVREWLKALPGKDCQIIGKDIQVVQFRWPLGMPLVRKIDSGLWEVRSNVSDGCIARVLFTVDSGEMVLLHGMVKKSRGTPKGDLELAKSRRARWFNS